MLNSYLASLVTFFVTIFNSQPADKIFSDPDYLQVGCMIVDSKKTIVRQFDFETCLFWDDGKVLAMDPGPPRRLIMFDGSGNKLWVKNINAHHSLNTTIDNKKIIALFSEDAINNGILTRYDGVELIDLSGKTLKKFSFAHRMNQIANMVGYDKSKNFYLKYQPGYLSNAKQECSHLNSVYEIGEVKSGVVPHLKKGNFLVNLGGPLHPILILDQNLTEILWATKTSKSLHTVQALEDGSLFAYQNYDYQNMQDLKTMLLRFDPANQQTLWSYHIKGAPKSVYSPTMGAAHIFKKKYVVFSEQNEKSIATINLIDLNGKTLWSFNDDKSLNYSQLKLVISAKILNLAGFIRNNKM